MEYEIFSKRQQRMQGETSDTYPSESIPRNLRIQVLYIWGKVWEDAYYNCFDELQLSELARDAYNSIEMTLREEYGVLSLDGDDHPDKDDYDLYRTLRDFLLETENTDHVIDIIEVSFRYIDQVIRNKFYPSDDDRLAEIFGPRLPDILPGSPRRDISYDGIPPDDAIDLLNQRFREHNVWYKYESGHIVKVGSQDSRSEVVKPVEELPNNTQQAVNKSPINNENKKIFIGHGRAEVWRVLKDFIVDRLGLEYEEFNRISPVGKSNKERLKEMLEACDMAFLVMTGEDEQADGSFSARDNVIHEAGLFQGKIGFERAIILREEGCQEFSNIEGLGQIQFPQGNIRAVFEDIREVLRRESILGKQPT